jgi:formate dehydrogenase alpha subunit
MADVVLPGTSFAEKSGSVTSLDHRVSCLGKALTPVGEAREDLEILADLYARVAGNGQRPLNAEAVLIELKELTPLYSEVCFTGPGGCRPCLKEPYVPEEKSLTYVPVEGSPAETGLQLLSGKILYHFGTTSTYADGCLEAAPSGYIEIHPEDAKACGVADGGRIKVTSAAGSAQGPVLISGNVPKGLLFAPYHFSELNIQQVIPQGRNRAAVEITRA